VSLSTTSPHALHLSRWRITPTSSCSSQRPSRRESCCLRHRRKAQMASELLPFDHSMGPRTGSHRRLTPYVWPQVPSDLGQQCMPCSTTHPWLHHRLWPFMGSTASTVQYCCFFGLKGHALLQGSQQTISSYYLPTHNVQTTLVLSCFAFRWYRYSASRQ
jgi:hypothetical protein